MFMLFPIMMDRFIDRTHQRVLLLYEHISALKSKMVTDGFVGSTSHMMSSPPAHEIYTPTTSVTGLPARH